MNCPVCSSKLSKTEFFNKILKQYNYQCEECESFHIPEEIDISDYYRTEYHAKFTYDNIMFLPSFSFAFKSS